MKKSSLTTLAKYALFGLFIQCFALFPSFAKGDSGMLENVKEVKIVIGHENSSVREAFSTIESNSIFRFAYDKKDVNLRSKLNLSEGEYSVADLLERISRQTSLSFKQINNTIYVKKEREIRREVDFSGIHAAQKRSNGLSVERIASQTHQVRGKVTSYEDNSGLPGVNVLVRGTTTGTTTDVEGNYTLQVPGGNEVLVFSYIGFVSEEIPVNSRSIIDVALAPDIQQLSEIVVIGYGTVKRKDLTGAVVSMKNEDIMTAPTNNVMEALQGKIPGMDIVKTSGRVGEGVNILLRGTRSIYGDNTPLFIIDGIPGSYNEINPSDIESVDILKDASSTAIYGSAGANGVVIITTKRGKEGETRVNFDAYYGFSGEPEYFHGMKGEEWTNYQREAYKYLNGQYPADMSAILTDADKLAAYNDGKWIDWVDEAAGNVATNQKYSLSIQGGNENTRTFTSFSYDRQEGLLRNENLNRYAVRFNLDKDVFSFLSAGITSNLLYSIRNNGVKNTFTKALSSFPLGNAYDENGNIIHEFATNEFTPLGDFIPNQFVNNNRNAYVNTNAFIEVKPLDGLSFKSIINTTLSNTRLGQYWGAKANALRPTYAGTPHAEIDNSYSYGYTWDNVINYNKMIGYDHSLAITLISSWSKDQDEENTAGGSGQNLDAWSFYRLMSAQSQHIESIYTQTQRLSYAGRINYSFKDRYLVSLSNRYDGVSWLSEGSKWDNFPAAAFGWRISEESFMSNSANWIDDLKLRVSYGITGNSGGIGAYGTTTTPYAYSSNGISIDGSIVPFTQYTGTYGNPGLGWEKSYNYNIGIDFSILENRISGAIDWFNTKTKDLLFKRTMPITSGITGWGAPLPSWENIAETRNEGVELSLNTRNIDTKDFKWNSSLSLTWGKEEIVSLPSGDLIAESLFEGYPIKTLYDYRYAGIWSSSSPSETLDDFGVKPGWVKIVTTPKDDENGVSDNGIHPYSQDDKQKLGHLNPDYIVGFNNTFSYKNFDLTVFTMGRYGQTIMSDLLGFYDAKLDNQIAGADYWTEQNQNAYYPAPGSGSEQAAVITALKYRDGSFIKVKNITLGYSLPESLTKSPYLENCRFYATAYNPFLYVKDKQLRGTDPETNGSDNFPLFKQFVFGVNVTF